MSLILTGEKLRSHRACVCTLLFSLPLTEAQGECLLNQSYCTFTLQPLWSTSFQTEPSTSPSWSSLEKSRVQCFALCIPLNSGQRNWNHEWKWSKALCPVGVYLCPLCVFVCVCWMNTNCLPNCRAKFTSQSIMKYQFPKLGLKLGPTGQVWRRAIHCQD